MKKRPGMRCLLGRFPHSLLKGQPRILNMMARHRSITVEEIEKAFVKAEGGDNVYLWESAPADFLGTFYNMRRVIAIAMFSRRLLAKAT